MLTLCIKHIPNINQDFGIDTEVLHSGIVPKPKLWYRAIPSPSIAIHSGLAFDNVAHMEESEERKTEKTEEERQTDRQRPSKHGQVTDKGKNALSILSV